MPLYDALGGTINSESWELQKQVDQGTTPDLVLVDVLIDAAATHQVIMHAWDHLVIHRYWLI